MSKTATSLRAISYASCSVPEAPVRREASHRSEQTSQLLFGERVEVLQMNAETEWAHIRCAWDGYEGWCKAGQLGAISPKDFRKAHVISASHKGVVHLEKGAVHLPLCSELTGMKKSHIRVDTWEGKFKGKKVNLGETEASTDLLLDTALSFLHAPYHWGGRSLSGIDCSGLMQIAFKRCGISIPRDAADQVLAGTEVHFLAESQPGDVAFFDNAEGRIVHVGILVNKDTIIHATDTAGRVVEDRIDNAGIVSVSLKRRTHKLRTIRRISLQQAH